MVIPLSQRLVYLRKEKGFSQKKVSCDLGVSQALLSHYERGIRECGLDFLVRVANYYSVSCDYLLGCTMEKYPETSPLSQENAPISQKLIGDSVELLLDISSKCDNSHLNSHITEYFYMCIYKIFRIFYEAKNNPTGLLTLPGAKFPYAINSKLTMCECEISHMLSPSLWVGSDHPVVDYTLIPTLTYDELTALYPQYASSLFHVLHKADILGNSEEYNRPFIKEK